MTYVIDSARFGSAGSTLLTGLVSWWTLDETSGNRADAHGSNTLTDNNTVTSATGKQSNAAQFTSANMEYLSRAAGHGLQAGARSFTIASWVYLDTLGNQTLASVDPSGTSNIDYILEQATSRFKFWVNGGSWTGVVANTFGAPSLATWYLVIGWYDYITKDISISVNNGTTDSVAGPTTPNDTGSAFLLGARDVAIPSHHLNGRQDEVAFWSRLLTADERTELYNSGSGIGYPG